MDAANYNNETVWFLRTLDDANKLKAVTDLKFIYAQSTHVPQTPISQ